MSISIDALFCLDFDSFCLTKPRCELHTSLCPVPLLLETIHHALPELGRPLVLGQIQDPDSRVQDYVPCYPGLG